MISTEDRGGMPVPKEFQNEIMNMLEKQQGKQVKEKDMNEKAKAYEYIVILRPTDEEKNKGEIGTLYKDTAIVLAKTEEAAKLKAMATVSEKLVADDLTIDRLEIIIRPFVG